MSTKRSDRFVPTDRGSARACARSGSGSGLLARSRASHRAARCRSLSNLAAARARVCPQVLLATAARCCRFASPRTRTCPALCRLACRCTIGSTSKTMRSATSVRRAAPAPAPAPRRAAARTGRKRALEEVETKRRAAARRRDGRHGEKHRELVERAVERRETADLDDELRRVCRVAQRLVLLHADAGRSSRGAARRGASSSAGVACAAATRRQT